MNENTESLTFNVPLSYEAHELAEKNSKQHNRPQKAKQVYLNTLAVYAVKFYLQCMGYEIDENNSDYCDPLTQKFLDVADLEVIELGKLECRPVLPDAKVFEVPPEAWDNRIAYVAVQLNQSLKEAILIGFVLFVKQSQGLIPLKDLRSIAEFPEYLSQKAQPLPQFINLGNWLTKNNPESNWQTIEDFFGSPTTPKAVAFRSLGVANLNNDPNSLVQIIESVKDEEIRWDAAELLWQLDPNHPLTGVRKILDLGMLSADYPVALMVGILPKTDGSRAILLRLYPIQNQSYLPSGIQLIVLDSETGNPITYGTLEAGDTDVCIQLRFSANVKDTFGVRVALKEPSITQFFEV